MKKLLTLMLTLIIIFGTFVGCDAKPNQEKSIDTVETVTEKAVKDETIKKNEPVEDELVPNDNINEEEIQSNQEINVAPEILWTAKNFIEFELLGEKYRIGDSCKDIVTNFEIAEIVDGHVHENNMAHVGEKVTLNLSDGTNEFLVVVRNDVNQDVDISNCTLHEVFVNPEGFDMSKFTICDMINGNASIDEWDNTFGEDYTDFSSEFMLCHSWTVAEGCYVDVFFDVDSKDLITVQMMTY